MLISFWIQYSVQLEPEKKVFLFCPTLLFQITKQSQSVPISSSNQKGIRNRSSSRGKRTNFSVSKVYIKFATYKASIFPEFLDYILQIIIFCKFSKWRNFFFMIYFVCRKLSDYLCCLSRWNCSEWLAHTISPRAYFYQLFNYVTKTKFQTKKGWF